jgi:hypothetical protein
MNRFRLIRKPGFVKCAKEPVSAAISREYPASSIAAVSRRRKPDHQQARFRIPKARDWPGPIVLVGKTANFFASDPLAPLDETRA